MNRAYLTAAYSIDHLRGVGIGVYENAQHIGLICRNPTGEKRQFIHLAFHEDLRVEDDTSKCFLWAEPKLEEEQANIIAAQARHVLRKYQSSRSMPYGFSPYTGYFGPQGEIRWTADGGGLTCATFVLAVFDAGGVQLVKGETWPIDREEDKQFQLQMITLMRNHRRATNEQIETMTRSIGRIRFQVLEVAGAVAADVYPTDFTTACALGQQLHEMIASASRPPSSPAPQSKI